MTGSNDAPVAANDSADGSESLPFTIDVLSNDSDVDSGDTPSVSGLDTSGTTGAVSIVNGEIVYDPNSQFDGLGLGDTALDSFAYTIDDGHGGTDIATVNVTVHGHAQGTSGPDTLMGTAYDDLIDGGDGADVIDGGAGVDTLYGGGADGDVDYFVFHDGDALVGSGSQPVERIMDFEDGTDLIDLSAFSGIASFANIQSISDDGFDTTIQLDVDDRIVVIGVTGMDASDFNFVA